MKYTIMAVDRAGTPWEVCQTNEADSALMVVRGLRKERPWERTGMSFWPMLMDDVEAGDVEAVLEEMEEERQEQKKERQGR